MFKFQPYNVGEMLGYLPVSQVQDEEIWQHVVSPITKGLLGPIAARPTVQLLDTVSGLFPGDEVSNLNQHRINPLHRGPTRYVRFPYLHSMYKTKNGYFIIKRDGMKFEAFGWLGDVLNGRGELILKVGLRDRRFDGTLRANDCALLEFPYDDAVYHTPDHPELKALELSVYGFMPGSRIADATGEPEFEQFFANPFSFMDRPQLFLDYFKRAWKTKRAPGQIGAPIKDVSTTVLRGAEKIAVAHGYDVMEMACSHYHVVKWTLSAGYSFSDATQASNFDRLQAGLARIRAAGHPMTRTQQSWACALQNLLPHTAVPSELDMPGTRWEQDNISPECIWTRKPLTTTAKRILNPIPQTA